MDDPLIGREPPREGHPDAESSSLEREEANDGLLFYEDADPGLRAEMAHCHRILRREERVGQARRGLLHQMPHSDLARAEITGVDDVNPCHATCRTWPLLPRAGLRRAYLSLTAGPIRLRMSLSTGNRPAACLSW